MISPEKQREKYGDALFLDAGLSEAQDMKKHILFCKHFYCFIGLKTCSSIHYLPHFACVAQVCLPLSLAHIRQRQRQGIHPSQVSSPSQGTPPQSPNQLYISAQNTVAGRLASHPSVIIVIAYLNHVKMNESDRRDTHRSDTRVTLTMFRKTRVFLPCWLAYWFSSLIFPVVLN